MLKFLVLTARKSMGFYRVKNLVVPTRKSMAIYLVKISCCNQESQWRFTVLKGFFFFFCSNFKKVNEDLPCYFFTLFIMFFVITTRK